MPHADAVPRDIATNRTTARIFDIASPPGGMDHQALVGAGLEVQWVRGLGGLRAPASMAEAQLDFVHDLLDTSGTTDRQVDPAPAETTGTAHDRDVVTPPKEGN